MLHKGWERQSCPRVLAPHVGRASRPRPRANCRRVPLCPSPAAPSPGQLSPCHPTSHQGGADGAGHHGAALTRRQRPLLGRAPVCRAGQGRRGAGHAPQPWGQNSMLGCRAPLGRAWNTMCCPCWSGWLLHSQRLLVPPRPSRHSRRGHHSSNLQSQSAAPHLFWLLQLYLLFLNYSTVD